MGNVITARMKPCLYLNATRADTFWTEKPYIMYSHVKPRHMKLQI